MYNADLYFYFNQFSNVYYNILQCICDDNTPSVLAIAHDHDYALQSTQNNYINDYENITLPSIQNESLDTYSNHTFDDPIGSTLLNIQSFGVLRYDYDEVIIQRTIEK